MLRCGTCLSSIPWRSFGLQIHERARRGCQKVTWNSQGPPFRITSHLTDPLHPILRNGSYGVEPKTWDVMKQTGFHVYLAAVTPTEYSSAAQGQPDESGGGVYIHDAIASLISPKPPGSFFQKIPSNSRVLVRLCILFLFLSFFPLVSSLRFASAPSSQFPLRPIHLVTMANPPHGGELK